MKVAVGTLLGHRNPQDESKYTKVEGDGYVYYVRLVCVENHKHDIGVCNALAEALDAAQHAQEPGETVLNTTLVDLS